MIFVITADGTGGAFVDWTINYLNGRIYYQSFEDSFKITESPLTSMNSHGHSFNYINISELGRDKCREKIQYMRDHNFLTLFCSIHNADQLNLLEFQHNDNIVLLSNRYNRRYSHSFKRSVPNLHEQTLTQDELIDQLEHVNHLVVDKYIDLVNMPAFILDTRELYTVLDIIIYELFDYLNLTMDETRLENWLIQFNKWKGIQYTRNKFSINFNRIIEYINKGVDYNLIPYKLDKKQEASIRVSLKANNTFLPAECEFTNTKLIHQQILGR